jgi:hypothetical protein
MKNIIIILLTFILLSCGVSKKATKTDTHLAVKTEIQKNDSSRVQITREDLINSIVEMMDLSTTKITFYNPPDSTGKQTINAVMEKESKVKTTTTTSKKENENTAIKTGSNESSKQDTDLDQHQTTTEKKNKSPWKIYIFSILISGILIFFVFRWIRKKFLL